MARRTRNVVRGRVQPPPLATALVFRPRLQRLIGQLIKDFRIVCVTASAGAGKTTAVLEAARAAERPVAWLSADATDAATGHFLVYLEAALASQVPGIPDIVTSAMAAGTPHLEVAAMLAEEIGDVPLVLVIDDLERIAAADATLAVLSSFIRYLPHTARLVLVSRRDVPIDLGSNAIGAVAGIGEEDLAFTLDETRSALALAEGPELDAPAALKATNGWVAGVLFEAWRSAEHVPGMGGEADPLHGYLASQILDALTAEQNDFLIITSVLHQVTPADAGALGVADAEQMMRSLHRRHLPVSWDAATLTMRCHPRFREYLLELLNRWPSQGVRRVRRQLGALLVSGGHYEEAVREFLVAGAREDALAAAEHCLVPVIERGDLLLATEWLRALAPVCKYRQRLAPAELMLAVAAEDYNAAVEVASDLAEAGELEKLAGASSRGGALMSWCFMHVGQLERARSLIEVTAPGPPREAMRYCLTMMEDEPPKTAPPHLSGDSFDALIMRCHYYRGDFTLTNELALSGWAARVGESWRIGALLDTGHTEQAVRLFEAHAEGGASGAWFSGVLAVRVMRRLGRVEDARRALFEGRARIRQTGSRLLETFSDLEEAELELRLSASPEAATAVLSRVLESSMGSDYSFLREQALVLLGLASLQRGDDADAAQHLAAAIHTATRGKRWMVLPHAGIYLAEAQWRLGNADAADDAADIALDAAGRQGSNYLLLEAIDDFPAVLSRRLDAEASGDSPWHTLARTRVAQGGWGGAVAPEPATVLAEFGRMAIIVDGVAVKPRIKKSYELLAYLATKGAGVPVGKTELLDVLFGGRGDTSAQAYLRQAVHQLRQVLPPGSLAQAPAGVMSLDRSASVASESVRLQKLLAQAFALRGQARLDGIRAALEVRSGGTYLPGVGTPWAELHRAELEELVTTAHFEAAETAYELEQLAEAQHWVEEVLKADPYREPAWRLAMNIAHARGDEAAVVTAFRGCERALRELGTQPTQTTCRLLERLRR